MKSFIEIDQDNKGDYLKLLTVTAKLSKLFSDNSVPYIYTIELLKIFFVEVLMQIIFLGQIPLLMLV